MLSPGASASAVEAEEGVAATEAETEEGVVVAEPDETEEQKGCSTSNGDNHT